MWNEFMDELRTVHLGVRRGRSKASRTSVAALLQAAYEAIVAKRKNSVAR
jgi:hypothetical protein